MGRRLQWSFVLSLGALCLGACSEPVDQAAKARIFSPEDPPKVVASAKESLSARGLADSPEAARRVLRMGAAEITERVGPHRYQATLAYEWAAPGGAVKLSETRTVLAGPGGVSGDFHGTLENSRDQGLEVMRVKGQVFARNRYGTFRQRLRDRGMAERTRTELTGALRDMDALFQGRLQLAAAGSGSHEGRPVQRYTVSLGERSEDAAASSVRLPPMAQPRNGRDTTTQRRAAFFEKREPRALTGEVWVDDATAVVVKAQLRGKLHVPGSEKTAGAADLQLTLDSALGAMGKNPGLAPPAEFLPDVDKPQGIADALDRFGIPRAGVREADGGTPPPEPEDEGG